MNLSFYALKTESGNWLGSIMISENGFFSAVTDWGNFSYQWTLIGDITFKEFICQLDTHYFASKMVNSVAYTCGKSKKIKDACLRFSEHILPSLQEMIKKEEAES